MSTFLCLGIETSCDETAAAIVADGKDVLSSVVQTQIDLHKLYGGVVPEIACRVHIEAILPVIDKALSDANVKLADIDAIAVTNSPGLVGALLVGVSAGKALALAAGKPLIGVNHILAHIYANKLVYPELPYPCISMVVSGGHTSLYLSKSEIEHTLLGATTDDAAGEAFDKVGKILWLPFPGGPSIEKAANQGRHDSINFPRTILNGDSLDFSFSGIKTAVLYYVKGQNAKEERTLTSQDVANISASFQEAIVDMLVEKGFEAMKRYNVNTIAIGGGVACNTRLREKFSQKAEPLGYKTYFPPHKFCTDNAMMVAGIGYHMAKNEIFSDLSLDAIPTKLC